MNPKPTLIAELIAEFLGTFVLILFGTGVVAMVVLFPSSNPGETIHGGFTNITLGWGLAVTMGIYIAGKISGAHLNPVVTLADAMEGGISWTETPAYIFAQVAGGISGAIVAHSMFGLPIVSLSRHARSGAAQMFSEFVATFGLLAVIWGCSRLRSNATAFAVGAYITAAYWFTASTSFANPAVTIARSLSDTFSGIRPADAPGFIVAQIAGAIAATLLFRWLIPALPSRANDVVYPHGSK